MRRVKQTDQNWAVSKEIWSSSYSLCRWMGGIRCGFCMVFMMRLDLSNGLRLVPVHARHSESQCVVDAHLCCPLRRWRLPSLTCPFIDFVAILLHARIACSDCLVRQTHLSTSTPDSPSARKHQQSRSISLDPRPSTHAPRRRIPLFTSSITSTTFQHVQRR